MAAAIAAGAFRVHGRAAAAPVSPFRRRSGLPPPVAVSDADPRIGPDAGSGAEADPDLALVRRIGAGDEAAFRALVARKLGRIHGVAARLLGDRSVADDVAQEALLRVWRHAGSWEAGGARFDTWLHRVVLNLCTDRLRRRREVLTAEPPDAVDPAIRPDAALERDDEARTVRDAVAGLPDRQREALTLHVWADLSNIAIADAMNISVDAVESLLARGRRTLRGVLGGSSP